MNKALASARKSKDHELLIGMKSFHLDTGKSTPHIYAPYH